MRLTRILATIGPASASPSAMQELVAAGADALRFNASHSTSAELGAAIRAAKLAVPGVPRLLDLGGPKVRLGELDLKEPLVEGRRFGWRPGPGPSDDRTLVFGTPDLEESLSGGARVALADGRVILRADRGEGGVVLELERASGVLRGGAGVVLPLGALGDVPILGRKDLADLEAGLEAGVTVVAASFVRGPEDVETVRDAIAARGGDALVMAKIERPEAVETLEETVAAADMVMVARGDLGAALGLEKVPGVQERITRLAREKVVAVVVATEVLESMVHAASPTRAEVMDIDNCVAQGADLVCLSAETAIGDRPAACVRWLARILAEADGRRGFDPVRGGDGLAEQISVEAADLAARTGAAGFIVVTRSGFSARNVARHRSPLPILAVVASEAAARRVSLLRAVWPLISDEESLDGRLRVGMEELMVRGWVGENDVVVGALGLPHEGPGATSGIFLLRAPGV
ncbi:hypothetical protein IIA16_02890 [bacterium]|nr:hypothetical protein [bacterium]